MTAEWEYRLGEIERGQLAPEEFLDGISTMLRDLVGTYQAVSYTHLQYIATALEIYVTGSLNVFNHQSNVDINNRIVCYDIKELGKQLKKIGMLVVQDQVWNLSLIHI